MKNYNLIISGVFMLAMFTTMHAQKLMKNILSPYQYETKYLALGELEIAYIHEGAGPETIILVHGLSSNADAWQNNIAAFAKHYEVIAIDLPGFGKSTKENQLSYTPSYYAEVIKYVADNFHLDKFYLAGHSMGGQVAIKFATMYPEMLSKLVLVAPAGIEKFNENQANLIKKIMTVDYVKNTSTAQIQKNYALNFHQMPDEVEPMIQDRIHIRQASDFDKHAHAIVQSVHGMLNEPIFDDLKDIHVPTLVIFGKHDQLIPNKFLNPHLTTEVVGNSAIDNLPNSTLALVDKAGHFVMLEKSDFVNDIILVFLKKMNEN